MGIPPLIMQAITFVPQGDIKSRLCIDKHLSGLPSGSKQGVGGVKRRRQRVVLMCLLLLETLLLCSCIARSNIPSQQTVEIERYEEMSLKYTIQKIDFYEHPQVQELLDDDLIMHDARDNVILYSSQYFDNPLGTGRAKVNMIGTFSLQDNSMRFIKPATAHVVDAILESDYSFICSGLDSGSTQWSVTRYVDGIATILDTGTSQHVPEFARVGAEIVYLYEKQSLVDGKTRYEYGVNALRDRVVVPLVRVMKEYELGTTASESLLSLRLIASGENYALLIRRDGKAVVDIFAGNTRSGSITLQDKIYDMALLDGNLFCSLQDRTTGKPKLQIVSLEGVTLTTKINEESPYFRMRTLDGQILFAVDMYFNTYILDSRVGGILRRAFLIEGHDRQPVGFYPMDPTRTLIHFNYASEGKNRAMYLLEIVD